MVARFGFDEPQGLPEEVKKALDELKAQGHEASAVEVDPETEEGKEIIAQALAMTVLKTMGNSEFLPMVQCSIFELWRRIEEDPARFPLDAICDSLQRALERFEELKGQQGV